MAKSRLTMRSGSFPLALSLPATSARFTALMAAPSRRASRTASKPGSLCR